MARYNAGKRKSGSRGWLKRNWRRAKPIYNMAKSRYAPTGQIDISKIQSDINYAKNIATTALGLLNTEKKRSEFSGYGNIIGQCSGNNAAYYSFEITPTISQGTGYGNRTGSSISLRSTHIQGQVIQQSACTQRMIIHLYLIQTTTGDPFDVSEFFMYNKFLYAQNTTAIYDTQCERDPDYFRKYRVLRKKVLVLNRDMYNGSTNYPQVCTFKMGMKYGKKGKHVRFNDNTNNPSGNRFYLLGVADCGNAGGGVSTLNGISVQTASTGATINIEGTNYFIDN